ncbi:MAG: cation-translocating P-type ATPase [Clostridiales bacterium]|nr:cation-translocating P-type ATPase [Clostridiales bacterium]
MENRGLSGAEAARLLKEHGRNELPTGKKHRLVSIIAGQFKDCMVIVLIAAAVVSAFLGEFTEAFTVLGIVLANALLGTVQSWRTEKAVAALGAMTAPGAKVFRDGEVRAVPAAELVPGDLLVLSAGDRVGADAEILTANSLACDESMLTGESLPAEKPSSGGMVFMGTMVVSGSARAVVRKTGADSEMGKIAGMLSGAGGEQTPLQQRLKTLGRILLLCCLFVCAGVSLTGYLRGEDLLTMFLSGVSLAVAAIPEGLPAVVTVSLALGVTRMSRRSAMIRRMPAVETLGCVEVICSDKTGTLTENRMKLDRLYVPGEPVVRAEEMKLSGEKLLSAAVLASEAEPSVKKGKLEVSGSPTEAAIVRAAAERGIYRSDMCSEYRLEREHVFTSERKRMSRVYSERKGGLCSFVKGAPELILPRCTHILRGGKAVPVTDSARREASAAMSKMASEGERVIAVAGKRGLSGTDQSSAESGLTFYGLAGLLDPPRKEAADAVADAKRAGIRTVMITGDSADTAGAIASRLGIVRKDDRIISGPELDRMSDGELSKVCPEVSVYARVAPSHKHRIVRALKKRGYVTAMTGDGVNDAPAVREADVGIAMGISGTDVTREAADVVLADDNFASIVDAVRQGRMIYDNIRKFLRYMLSSNLGEVLTMFAAILFVLPLPLMPVHILLVNLVTDGLPAMALSMDPADGDVMRRPPRGRNEGIFAGGLGVHILLRGIFIAAGTIGVFTLALASGETAARTAAFFTLASSQLIFVFECRSERRGMFSRHIFANRWLVGAVLISGGLMTAAIYIPALQTVFGFEALSKELFGISLGTAFGGAALSSVINLIFKAFRKKNA